MKQKTHLHFHHSHRYLGLLTGLQFIMWSVGGLYFSWSDIDEIQGDHLRKQNSRFKPRVKKYQSLTSGLKN